MDEARADGNVTVRIYNMTGKSRRRGVMASVILSLAKSY